MKLTISSRITYTILLDENLQGKAWPLPRTSPVGSCTMFSLILYNIHMSLHNGLRIHRTPPAMGFLQILSPLSGKIFLPSHCFTDSLKVSNIIPQRSLPGSSPQSHNSVKLCFIALYYSCILLVCMIIYEHTPH